MQALVGRPDASASTWLTGLLASAEPHAIALADRATTRTYAQLEQLVAARRDELGLPPRSLVVLGGERSIEYVVTYLALMSGGHVPILTAGRTDRLTAEYRPAATVHADAGGWSVRRIDPAAPALHPDLALLLSTSGSTGSPKLVRLSTANLAANATAIATSLGLTATDRGITALPLHYCYGLSVLHSHLAVGAGLVIETASVVDPCFRRALAAHGVTSIPTVAHMLELLEVAGPEAVNVPSLRLITHAGGRLDPEVARRWIERGDAWGAEFVSMYGQTEATARMAYLPPALARRAPGTVGLAIPGGELRVDPIGELPEGVPAGTGEIVYRGPNVMMGYAERCADLARGAELDELRTGDLGHRDPVTGALTIVGRRARFVKPFGVRIDLDQVERELRHGGFGPAGEIAVAGNDDGIVVAAAAGHADIARRHVVTLTGLPDHRVGMAVGVPRTAGGKPDYPSLLATGQRPIPSSGAPAAGGAADAFGSVLGLAAAAIAPTDTFVSLGGDSLSYVEVATRLEPLFGRLPADWHLAPVGELERLAAGGRPTRRRAWQWIDTTAVLRAAGICTVVLTHMRWAYFPGGAHILLAVVAYNLSRFLLPIDSTAERFRLGLRTVARVAVPTVLWVLAGVVLFGAYSGGTLFLVNNYVGPPTHRDDHWHFWFVEVFVHLVLLLLVALAIPAVRRFERRWQYLVPLALVAVGVLLRQEWAQGGDWYNLRFRTHGAFLFFALGWLVQRSANVRQRVLTSAIVVATVYDTFGVPRREIFIAAGLVALVWWREVPLPRPAAWLVTIVASASMWILITHFTVYPWMMDRLPIGWAYLATLTVGVGAWWSVDRATRRVSAYARRRASTDNRLVPGWSVA